MSNLEFIALIALFYGSLFVGDWLSDELRAGQADNTYIMIRKDSMERIIRNPCMASTIEYMGNYILCRRRADYEPRERMKWASPYPMRPNP